MRNWRFSSKSQIYTTTKAKLTPNSHFQEVGLNLLWVTAFNILNKAGILKLIGYLDALVSSKANFSSRVLVWFPEQLPARFSSRYELNWGYTACSPCLNASTLTVQAQDGGGSLFRSNCNVWLFRFSSAYILTKRSWPANSFWKKRKRHKVAEPLIEQHTHLFCSKKQNIKQHSLIPQKAKSSMGSGTFVEVFWLYAILLQYNFRPQCVFVGKKKKVVLLLR